MSKSPALVILVFITVLLSSVQLYFLFMFNGKIDQLEFSQQVLETKTGDAIINIQNLEAVIGRSFGKYIEVKTPPSFVKKIDDIEKKLSKELTIKEIITVEDDFNNLIAKTQKWVLDEQFRKLNSLSSRLKLHHLLLQAKSNNDEIDIDALIDAFEDSKFDLDKKEFDFYQSKIENLIAELKIKQEKALRDGLANIRSKLGKLSEVEASSLSEFRGLIFKLESYKNNSAVKELKSEIDRKIQIAILSGEMDRIQIILENPPDSDEESILELLSQSSSESARLYTSVFETENTILLEKHANLVKSIEKKVSIINQKINKKMNQRINNYNLWALDSINTFENKLQETKSKMGMFGDLKKDEGLKIIFNNLKKHMLTIDQNLLIDSVREIYAKNYAEARSLLDDEYYTLEISKASATTSRKILADTDGYAKENNLVVGNF